MRPPRTTPVTIFGPEGTSRLLAAFDAVFTLPLTSDGLALDVVELPPTTPATVVPGVSLESYRVPHTPESVAYSLSDGTHRVVCSGDTGFDGGFAEWAQGADLLLLECSLPDALGIPMHLTPEQCAQIAEISQPGMLVLTHFYPPVEEVDIASIVRTRYAGPLVLAHDGWSGDLGD